MDTMARFLIGSLVFLFIVLALAAADGIVRAITPYVPLQ